jgi:hypothetical protein
MFLRVGNVKIQVDSAGRLLFLIGFEKVERFLEVAKKLSKILPPM